MVSVRAAALRTGIVGGVLFSAIASIPNCGAWPFIVPALAGGVAFWIATDASAPHQSRRGMFAALDAGALAGLVFVIACTLVILVVGRTMLDAVTQAPIAAGKLLITARVELGLAMVGLIGVAVALLGGAAMMLVRRLRAPRRRAPAA